MVETDYNYKRDRELLDFFVQKTFTGNSNKLDTLEENNILVLSDLVTREPDDLVSTIRGFGWHSIKKLQTEFNPYNIYFGMDIDEYKASFKPISMIYDSMMIETKGYRIESKESVFKDSLFFAPKIFNNFKTERIIFLLGRLNSGNRIRFSSSILKTFSNNFPTVKDLKHNIKNKSDLLSIKSLGRKKIPLILGVFLGYHSTFEKMTMFLKKNNLDSLYDIKYSYNLRYFIDKNNLKNIEDLESFVDRMNLDNLRHFDSKVSSNYEERDILALLEMLSVNVNNDGIVTTSANLKSNKINFLSEAIDVYLNSYIVKDKEREMLLLKHAHNLTLNEVGLETRLTRERVRQVIEKMTQFFSGFFFHDIEYIGKHLFDLSIKNLRPIDIQFPIFNKKYKKKYNNQSYLNFLSYMFTLGKKKKHASRLTNAVIPFKNAMSAYDNILNELNSLDDFRYTIEDIYNMEDGYKYIHCLFYHMFPKDRNYLKKLDLHEDDPFFRLMDKSFLLDDEGFVCKRSTIKSHAKSIAYFIKCIDSPMHTDEFSSILLSNSIFQINLI